METLQTIVKILFNINILTITKIVVDTSTQASSSETFAVQSIKDLNWERVEQLTSPTTSYSILKDCISKGDGTPAQLERFKCYKNIDRYKQSVPAFRYNVAVLPPNGYTKHHWYIRTYSCNTNSYKHEFFIKDSKEEILDCINDAWASGLYFEPLHF